MEANKPRVGVRELRQNLSVYLDRVKRGESLVVTEYNQVVAILRPAPAMSLIERLVAEGRAKAPTRSFKSLPPAPRVRATKSLSEILQELREDRI